MRRFFYTLKQAFLQVLRNRAMSVASIFAITAMLLILSIFFILVINVNTAAQTIQQDYDSIEIYLEDDVTKEQANDIIMQVKELSSFPFCMSSRPTISTTSSTIPKPSCCLSATGHGKTSMKRQCPC